MTENFLVPDLSSLKERLVPGGLIFPVTSHTPVFLRNYRVTPETISNCHSAGLFVIAVDNTTVFF
jgi:hypothetical protein